MHQVPLVVRIQLGLFLTIAFFPGGLATVLLAELVSNVIAPWLHVVIVFTGGIAAQLGAAGLAHRIWPGLVGQGVVRMAIAGLVGPVLAALVLASSSVLQEDDILATPILLVVSTLAIVLATYGTPRHD
jgi:TM2 domain-containing membrane protein YozV